MMPTRKAGGDERGMMRQSSGEARTGQGEGHAEEGLDVRQVKEYFFSHTQEGRQRSCLKTLTIIYLFICIYFF